MNNIQFRNFKDFLNRAIECPYIHPIIFATFPLLTTFSTVFDQIELSKVYRPFLVLYLIMVILLILLNLIFRDRYKSAFTTSIILILFFYINYFDLLPRTTNILGVGIYRNWIYLVGWFAIIYLLNSKLFWGKIRPKILTQLLNITALILLLLPTFRLTKEIVKLNQDPLRSWNLPRPNNIQFNSYSHQEKPDIYYIILDGYGRADILNCLYDYDNSEFLKFLTENEFYIANKSQSNYTQTALSIASSLGMNYLSFFPEDAEESSNRDPLKKLIEDSKIQNFLKNQGYQTITFSSGYYLTENTNADEYLTPFELQFSNLEGLLFNRSAAKIITDLFGIDLDFDDFDTHHKRVLYTINELGKIASRSSDQPKFVFVHIIAPHPPFVFDRDGNLIEEDRLFTFDDVYLVYGSPQEYIIKYNNQLTFLNTILMETITQILSDSTTDPIIILQADHGPAAFFNPQSIQNSCASERFSILNAYHFPDGKQENLYESITPINTFRVVLDEYFDTELGLLEDKSFFSSWITPYKFIEMPGQIEIPCKLND